MPVLSECYQRFQSRRAFVLLAAGASLGLTVLPLAAAAKVTNLETLYVFGDSYSDAGNSGLLTYGNPTYPFGFPPAPYVGGRVSNGPVAVEQLWSLFNPSAPPLKPSLASGTNYAVNGATTGTDSQFAVDTNPAFTPVKDSFIGTSAYSQLNNFLTPPQTFQPDKTLFVLWLGANDGLYWQKTQSGLLGTTPGTILGAPPKTNQTVFQLLDNSASNIEIGVQKLIDKGAAHILVPNLLDLSKTPFFSGTAEEASVKFLVDGFNARLATKLGLLRTANPTVDLMAFDTYTLFNQIRAQPTSYGLTNVTDRCVAGGAVVAACNPDQWFFWDGNHPTAKGHSLIAQAMFQQVPGPLPLAGVATAFSWARRLRRRVGVVRASEAKPPSVG